MEPKIIRKEGFITVGLEISTTANTLQKDVSKLWEKAARLDLDNTIRKRTDKNLSLAFIRNWSEIESFTYFLGAEVDCVENIPPDCITQTIPTATYAVFDLVGKGANLIEPWPEIAGWLQSSQYEWVVPMNFREYDESTQGGKIYIPIANE